MRRRGVARQLNWRSHKDLPPSGLRSNSPYDPFARYGNKRHTTWIGYKVHLTETCDKNQVHLITNVQTTESHLADVGQTDSIHQSLADKELLPKEHLVDAGYVDATLLVQSKQKHDLELIGPVRDNVSWQSKIPDAYDLSRLKQYNQRAGVEGTISQAVRGFGLRECRYVGLDKVHLQHILTATAMNLVRLFAWFEGVPLAKTRVSSFAKLAPD